MTKDTLMDRDGMTLEQVEDFRAELHRVEPHTWLDPSDIDALCDLAAQGLRRERAEAVKMAPREPTDAMLEAAASSRPFGSDADEELVKEIFRDGYKAMLAAAPERGEGRKG